MLCKCHFFDFIRSIWNGHSVCFSFSSMFALIVLINSLTAVPLRAPLSYRLSVLVSQRLSLHDSHRNVTVAGRFAERAVCLWVSCKLIKLTLCCFYLDPKRSQKVGLLKWKCCSRTVHHHALRGNTNIKAVLSFEKSSYFCSWNEEVLFQQKFTNCGNKTVLRRLALCWCIIQFATYMKRIKFLFPLIRFFAIFQILDSEINKLSLQKLPYLRPTAFPPSK